MFRCAETYISYVAKVINNGCVEVKLTLVQK